MKTIAPALAYATAGLLALSVLAGCSRSNSDEAPVDNALTEEAQPMGEEAPPPEPEPAPVAPAPVAATNIVAPPPAAEIAPDEQMLDDADATGMTARAKRDAPAAEVPQTNETEEK
jgi:hypothetical protein